MIDSCRSRADFAALRRGRRFGSELLWMSFAADPELERPRVAFALNRSSGTAVERNRARRRLRAVLGEHAGRLTAGRYLVGTRGSVSQVTYRRAQTQLLEMLTSAGALQRPKDSTT
ncbi:ribonuclease P protein component [Candidatus Poriferisodalis sp.]|uniref:ribonuclease P protein component n=1 Tax=Candidatus Poriferisodalis sp. TaxID=3101277 RepID=UPI003B02C979